MIQYGYKKQTSLSFDRAVEKARAELAKEGFGAITEIDAKATFKKKLDVDFDSYVILGACHPASAYKILKMEKDLGLLLPCNVVVYEEKGLVYVSAILPTVAMAMTSNPKMSPIAMEVEKGLKRVIDAI